MSTIRFILILFLSGCSIIQDNSNKTKNIQSIYGGEIKINQFEVETLGETSELWKNGQDILLVVNFGKVEKTSGLKNNVDYINLSSINYELLLKNKTYKTSAQIKFSNPRTNYLNIKLEYKLLSESKKFFKNCNSDCFVVEETFNAPLIRWSGENYYLINNNELVESIQTVTPFSKKIRIFHAKK